MRGAQLADLARASTLSSRSIAFTSIEQEFRGADLFLTKGAARSVTESILRAWRRAGNRIFFDPVDESVSDALIGPNDTVVAASRTALAAYRDRWPHLRVRLVNHHVDPRVRAAMQKPHIRSAARVAYFGELENAVLGGGVADLMDVYPVDTSKKEQTWFSHLPEYGLHYAVRRRRELDHHKPFLKGFTAAACGANVLIQRDEHEARLWLPEDYPFWVDAPLSTEAITQSIEAAQDSFDTPQWRYGLEVMRNLERATAPSAIARSLEMLFG